MRFVSLFLLTLITVSIFGCGHGPVANYDLVELLKVSGTVTLDGAPLPDAVITFEDPEEGTFSYAMTDFDGKYSLRFDSEMMGCTPGEKKVQISTSRKILGLNSFEEGGDTEEGKRGKDNDGSEDSDDEELVPDRYHKNSDLLVQVDSSSLVHDFELTTK